jgi:hypothetical protein
MAEKTYNGEVPMSPKIIPSVTSKPAAEIFFRLECIGGF